MRNKGVGIVLIAVIVGILFPDYTFANVAGQAEDKAELFGKFLDILSWLWVVPATVAGKLLTNDFVYGEVIGMTGILWKIWQQMRVYAYFILGFVFIALLIKHIIVMDDTSKVADTLKKTFIAGILIQMSWFFMAVMVDLSIVATAAVGAIPLQIMQQQRDQLQYKFKVPIMQIESQDGTFKLVDTQAETTQITLEDVTPDATTVAGPLVFLAGGVMRLMDARFIDGKTPSRNYSALVIGAGLKLMITVLFIVPMVLLAIINAIRIFWIWIWIIASPLLVLDMTFNGPLQSGEHADKFKPSAILGLIFQPVAVVGLLSLGLVMIVGILDSLLGGEEHKRESLHVLQAYILDDGTTQVGTGANGETFIVGELFKDLGGGIGGFIGEMILAFFAIFLLFAMLKVGSSFSSLTSTIADRGFTFMKDGLKTLPIPGVGSLGAAGRAIDDVKSGISRRQEQSYDTYADKTLEPIRKMFGIEANDARGGLTVAKSSLRQKTIDTNKGNPRAMTRAFFDQGHEFSKTDSGITYTGDVKKRITNWFQAGGKDYLKGPLGLADDATVDDAKVQQFVAYAIAGNNIDTPGVSSSERGNLTEATTWKQGKRSN